ncbi:hypothetical protein GGQ68_004678 [Sagittula marina]|uniref:Uncharacterized protein n=1 Tax=Sagittula marina TaxID=943940 RepID=A0A7W6GU85_9RHOB|nr:hypothetical protein [Sagittula marina]
MPDNQVSKMIGRPMNQPLSSELTADAPHPELSATGRFLHELRRLMPPSYVLANGTIHCCNRSNKPGIPVCSPLQVSALVRDNNGQG